MGREEREREREKERKREREREREREQTMPKSSLGNCATCRGHTRA